MAKRAFDAYFIVLAVVKHEDRFLIIQEAKEDQAHYLPAGVVEPGESLLDAVVRETREEAGIELLVDGLARIEHDARQLPTGVATRLRFVFFGRAKDPRAVKRVPDKESLGAGWFTRHEVAKLPLRSHEVPELLALYDSKPSLLSPREMPYWGGLR